MKRNESIWERMPDETSQAFEAFKTFRDLGDKRTQTAVANQLGKSVSLMQRWATKHCWNTRALEYDNHLERESVKEAVKQAKSMRSRHIKMGMYLQKIVADRLAELISSNLPIDPKELRLLLKDGMEIERLNRMEAAGLANGEIDNITESKQESHSDLVNAIKEATCENSDI